MISSKTEQKDNRVFSVTAVWFGTSDSHIFLISTQQLRDSGYGSMADELEEFVGCFGGYVSLERPPDAYKILSENCIDANHPIEIAGSVFGYLGKQTA